MISDVDRYHGAVLRQLILRLGNDVRLGVVNLDGRRDSFSLGESAFQIKHSSMRLSPWRFSYTKENLSELRLLSRRFDPVWAMLVCGIDGIVGLSLSELQELVEPDARGSAWIGVSRVRKSMYRVSGALGELPLAKARGVDSFLSDVARVSGARLGQLRCETGESPTGTSPSAPAALGQGA